MTFDLQVGLKYFFKTREKTLLILIKERSWQSAGRYGEMKKLKD